MITMLNDLSKRIGGAKDDPLINYFPPVLWVIHDFKGDLTDEYGMAISGDDYLDEALKNQEGFSKEVLELNKVRALYTNLFNDKHCFILPESSSSTNVDSQFTPLKELVLEVAKAKKINEATITGRAFIALTEKIVNILNKNTVTNIKRVGSINKKRMGKSNGTAK